MADPASGNGQPLRQGSVPGTFYPTFTTLPAFPRLPQAANRRSMSNMQPQQQGYSWSTSDVPSQHQYPEPIAQTHNVEMPSLYVGTPVDDVHTKWLGYFRIQLDTMKRNLDQWEDTLRQFELSQLSNRTESVEYKNQLIEVVTELEKLDYNNTEALRKMKEYVEGLPLTKSIQSEATPDAVCTLCQLAKPPSNLSCPFRHVLCLDCAGNKYLAKDLKCVCGCSWSEEQCRALHQALVAVHPEMKTSMPESPLLPLGEVKCECCQKSVGTAAIDPYICAQTHQICKSCAKRRGPRCPLCS